MGGLVCCMFFIKSSYKMYVSAKGILSLRFDRECQQHCKKAYYAWIAIANRFCRTF